MLPTPLAQGERIEALAVVADRDLKISVRVVKKEVDRGGLGVLERIPQAMRHDACELVPNFIDERSRLAETAEGRTRHTAAWPITLEGCSQGGLEAFDFDSDSPPDSRRPRTRSWRVDG